MGTRATAEDEVVTREDHHDNTVIHHDKGITTHEVSTNHHEVVEPLMIKPVRFAISQETTHHDTAPEVIQSEVLTAEILLPEATKVPKKDPESDRFSLSPVV